MQQGVWDTPMESMPLAAGYLKATALADERIAREAEIEIRNYRGGMKLSALSQDLFRDGAPDVLAFSVLGWNYREFGVLAETFKQLRPDGWVIFGGTHVANRAQRTFAMVPEVDVVVNGEGEFVFTDLVTAYLDGRSPRSLGDIDGISFQDPDGAVVTTPDRPRLEDLDVIPSPLLTGAIPLLDDAGEFRYDVALMETNRGCPYKCSFCYWGGAVGQRVRAFSRQRLRDELEFLAQHKVHTVVLCDANFGMLPIDAEFVADLLEIRERYGYPRTLETSWAKNKSKVFYEIVRDMKNAGMRSSFTLALQTLSDDALKLMNRRNMKVNDWRDLVEWLKAEELDCYAELIWGAPGESLQSFLRGYDSLAEHVSRIAVYPMLLLPNTEYFDKKEAYGFVTVRGDTDDFEYVLAHHTMPLRENLEARRFIFYARVLAENLVLRHVWAPARVYAGLSQSTLLLNFADWLERQDDTDSAPLREAAANAAAEFGAVSPALVYMYGDPRAKTVLSRWWQQAVRPLVPESARRCLDEAFRYDIVTQPTCAEPGSPEAAGLDLVDVDGEAFLRGAPVEFEFDVPRLVEAIGRGDTVPIEPRRLVTSFYYKVGFAAFVATTNHEQSAYFLGRPERDVLGGRLAQDVAG
ncbi:KedN5 family methylcobalamin-dependent radical SAM C-methyltransferase [Micromonospora sp. NPDC000442]|uniref:KedN5 family methylcobalamin-dependent radical SAM C-methyltransferase n=1 Tax=Micromonospora sp. NPDC000442 TaxID=3364217 RepID=UPI00369AA26B